MWASWRRSSFFSLSFQLFIAAGSARFGKLRPGQPLPRACEQLASYGSQAGISVADSLLPGIVHDFEEQIRRLRFALLGYQLNCDGRIQKHKSSKATPEDVELSRVTTGFPIYEFLRGQCESRRSLKNRIG